MPSLDASRMHDWYMAEPARTLADVGEQFGLSTSGVRTSFAAAELPSKPRGGGRVRTAPPPPQPATVVEGNGARIGELPRKLAREFDEELARIERRRQAVVEARAAVDGGVGVG